MAISQHDDTVRIVVYVQPKSSTFRWEKNHNKIKFWVTSPPSRGKANRDIVKHIARICRVPKSKVYIVSGGKSRKKIIGVKGIDSERVKSFFSRD